MGIGVSAPKLDLPAMMAFKDQGVDGNVKGVDFLLKKNKVDTFHGAGRIAAPGKVEVTGADGKTQTLEAKSIVIATGSDVAKLKGIEIDEKRIVSSTGALVLDKVPEHLLVVGAGVIGLELGSVWRRLGAQVTVVEFLDGVLPGMDGEVRRQAQRLFEKQGMTFKLSSKVTAVDTSGKRLKATIEPAKAAARRKPSKPTWCWSPSAACPTPMGSASRKRASSSTSAAASWSIIITPPACRASGRSATSSPGRCWRTKPRTKAWRWPKSWSGRPAT